MIGIFEDLKYVNLQICRCATHGDFRYRRIVQIYMWLEWWYSNKDLGVLEILFDGGWGEQEMGSGRMGSTLTVLGPMTSW